MLKSIILILTFFISFNVSAETFRVAVALRLNDLYHHYPKDILRGLEFALKENKTHWKIEYKIFSHNGSLDEMNRVIKQVEEYRPDLVVGGETSQMALYLNTKLNKFLFISPTASTDELFLVNQKSYRMIHSDIDYLRAVKFILKGKMFKNISVVHNISNPNTKKIGNTIISYLKSENYQFSIITTQNGVQTKRDDLIESIKSKVDLVIAFTYETDLRNIFLILSGEQISPLYLGADGWGRDEDLKKNLFSKNNLQFNSYRVSYWNPERGEREFKKKLNQLNNFLGKSSNQFHAIGHDTGRVILEVLEKSKSSSEFQQNIKTLNIFSMLTTRVFSFKEDNSPKKDLYLYNLSTSDSKIKYLRID
jgi:ABC-type uncharacterized transport system substrate-binding protein